jgi:hypothetical protein
VVTPGGGLAERVAVRPAAFARKDPIEGHSFGSRSVPCRDTDGSGASGPANLWKNAHRNARTAVVVPHDLPTAHSDAGVSSPQPGAADAEPAIRMPQLARRRNTGTATTSFRWSSLRCNGPARRSDRRVSSPPDVHSIRRVPHRFSRVERLVTRKRGPRTSRRASRRCGRSRLATSARGRRPSPTSSPRRAGSRRRNRLVTDLAESSIPCPRPVGWLRRTAGAGRNMRSSGPEPCSSIRCAGDRRAPEGSERTGPGLRLTGFVERTHQPHQVEPPHRTRAGAPNAGGASRASDGRTRG